MCLHLFISTNSTGWGQNRKCLQSTSIFALWPSQGAPEYLGHESGLPRAVLLSFCLIFPSPHQPPPDPPLWPSPSHLNAFSGLPKTRAPNKASFLIQLASLCPSALLHGGGSDWQNTKKGRLRGIILGDSVPEVSKLPQKHLPGGIRETATVRLALSPQETLCQQRSAWFMSGRGWGYPTG